MTRTLRQWTAINSYPGGNIVVSDTTSTQSDTSASNPGSGPDFDAAGFTKNLSEANARTLIESGIPLDYAVHDIGIYTARTIEDMPEDLKEYANVLPGTIFPLRSPDGTLIHQVRRDTIPQPKLGRKASSKYLQPKSTGALVTMHPNQLDRVGVATEIWIIEGTKQGVCASYYAPTDVLVLAIQGCTGWMSEGTGVPDLSQVVLDGVNVTIFFDADRSTKRGVYDAGVNLASYLTNLGAASVRYAARAGQGTAGLDDVLGKLPYDRRAGFMANLAANSSERPGRRPAAPLKTLATAVIECDMASGTTYQISSDEQTPPRVVFDAAARIVEVLNMADPDDPDKIIAPVLRLEVAIASSEGADKFEAIITSDKLNEIGSWLDQHPEGAGVSIARPVDKKDHAEIANAVRACEREETIAVHAVPRTGWTLVNGEWRYLHQGGSIGTNGNSASWRAHLPVRFRHIDYTSAVEQAMDPETLVNAVRLALIDAPGLLADPTCWWAGLGTVAISQSGSVPKAALGMVATKSAGKLLPLLTRIPTPTGWTTMGDLAVGDTVIGRDGLPTRVRALSDIDYSPELFDITLDDHQVIRACADHQWIVSCRIDGYIEHAMTTRQMIEQGVIGDDNVANFCIRTTKPIDGPDSDLGLDSYQLGAYLGGGVDEIAPRENVQFTERLNSIGLTPSKKFIPAEYLRGSAAQRLALLQGIMDTDGTIAASGRCELSLCNENLALDSLELMRSLGIKASINSSPATITEADPDNAGETRCRIVGTRWRIRFTTGLPAFRLSRKAARVPVMAGRRAFQSTHFYVRSIEAAPTEPGRCIEVDNDDHSYLVGEGYVPTHNSVVLQSLTAFLSPAFAYERKVMAVADGTANAIDMSMNGLDNSFLLVDDWHPEVDPRERFKQAKALDFVLRRVHGAPSKARAMIDRKVDGVTLAPVNNSHPALLLAMEKLPDRNDAESMLDRMLTLSLTAADTFGVGGAKQMTNIGQSGQLQIANAGYLMWLAAKIATMSEDPSDAMNAWRKELDIDRSNASTDLAAGSDTSTKRGVGVAASMLVGLEMFLDFATDIGAIESTLSDEIGENVGDMLLNACIAHTELAMGGNTTEAVNVVRTLKAAITAGELVLHGNPVGGQRRMGKLTTVNGVQCIAILTDRAFAGLDKSLIEGALRSACITGTDGDRTRYTHQVSFPNYENDENGNKFESEQAGRIRCYCIPLDVWDAA